LKISVVITAHNDVPTLATAINSVLSQTHKADELIVVDDGSKDATREVAKNFEQVTLLRQKEMGHFSACNNGVMMAEHLWVAFLDAKNSWSKEKLQKHVSFHQKNPQEKASVYVKEDVLTLQEALALGRVQRSNVVVEKALFERLGGFDEAFDVLEDDELWMRMTE